MNYKIYQLHLHQQRNHENASNSQTRRKSSRAVQLITLQRQCGTRQGKTAMSAPLPLVCYQAGKDCLVCISAAGMVPGNETLQLYQCRWYGTRQGNTVVFAPLPLECYQVGKDCNVCICAAGMVPGSETLQLYQCRWYGTRQRNTAVVSVPLVWYQAAKHCSCISAACMVPCKETWQCLPHCRRFTRQVSATRMGSASAVNRYELFILSLSSHMVPLYRREKIFRGFPI